MSNDDGTEIGMLIDEVRLGNEAERFLQSPLGIYVIEKAEQERQEALEDLLETPSSDEENIRNCQVRARIAEAIPLWLQEVINKKDMNIITIEEIEGYEE
ncbi:MAG: hypothetical protein SVO01_00520 [Thermotogota bacterium]|nr:hypothetical protein [Thermotogota bacterium]